MKVMELMERLKQLDPELEVLCFSEDSDLVASGHGFRLLDIVAVNVTEGEKRRGDDQVASLKIGKTELSQKHAIIEVTGDF